MDELKLAACVVVMDHIGNILGVSRRGHLEDFGLPGGKIDDGEQAIEAAARELYEETGVVLQPDELAPLHDGDDGHGYRVQTFLCTRPVMPSEAKQMEPDMAVKWVTPGVLINGSYGDYNAKVIVQLIRLVTPRPEK